MPRLVGVMLLVFALAACSSRELETPAYGPVGAFPPAPASIVGQGAYRREGGAWVSCAGYSVALMPDSPGFVHRVEQLYGTPSARLMASVAEVKARSARLPPSPEPAATSTCDAEGQFRFSGVPAGGYFLIARVKKSTGARAEDYVILERLMLDAGATANVSLAP
jgi:hypothetical protein